MLNLLEVKKKKRERVVKPFSIAMQIYVNDMFLYTFEIVVTVLITFVYLRQDCSV